MGINTEVLSRSKLELPCDAASPLLGMCPNNSSQLVTKILSQLCSIATALIIAKEWNQARCLSADA